MREFVLDSRILTCLNKWNLELLQKFFKENCVDYNYFKIMNETDIDKIIPFELLPEKCHFKYKLEKWRNRLQINKNALKITSFLTNRMLSRKNLSQKKNLENSMKSKCCNSTIKIKLSVNPIVKHGNEDVEMIINDNIDSIYVESKESSDCTTLNSTNQIINVQENNKYCNWLKRNNSPWSTVEEYWKITSQYRKPNKILLNGWILYSHIDGYKLIDIDFEYHFNGKLSLLMDKWNEFSQLFNEILSKKIRDKHVKKLLNEFSSADKNYQDSILIMALHGLVKPTKICKNKINNTIWRPNIEESQNSMIILSRIQSNVYEILQAKMEHYSEYGFKLKPVIIAIGNNLKTAKEFIVIYDQLYFTFDSILKALDICFKIYHVFNIRYPIESITTWLFIQKFLYNINSVHDPKIPTLINFLTELEK